MAVVVVLLVSTTPVVVAVFAVLDVVSRKVRVI
jgi:hypothetical protein